jgi:hypothetical protein
MANSLTQDETSALLYQTYEEPHPPQVSFIQSLDYNRHESSEIVRRNAAAIREASRNTGVPDWMIATIIYVETAQGVPGAWRWNDVASRDLFVSVGRPTSMGVMQVKQNPEELGLESHWQRMEYARLYEADESAQIADGAAKLRQVLEQSNRLGQTPPDTFQWSNHKLSVIAHEYNTGPVSWRGTEWQQAEPGPYGDLFVKFLPFAFQDLYGTNLTDWPLLDLPVELLPPTESPK